LYSDHGSDEENACPIRSAAVSANLFERSATNTSSSTPIPITPTRRASTHIAPAEFIRAIRGAHRDGIGGPVS
jgi:hypothetical protein